MGFYLVSRRPYLFGHGGLGMFRAGIARPVLAVVLRCDVFGSSQLRLGKSRQGGQGKA